MHKNGIEPGKSLQESVGLDTEKSVTLPGEPKKVPPLSVTEKKSLAPELAVSEHPRIMLNRYLQQATKPNIVKVDSTLGSDEKDSQKWGHFQPKAETVLLRDSDNFNFDYETALIAHAEHSEIISRMHEVWPEDTIMVVLESAESIETIQSPEIIELYELLATEITNGSQSFDIATDSNHLDGESRVAIFDLESSGGGPSFAEMVTSHLSADSEIEADILGEISCDEQRLEVRLAQIAAILMKHPEREPQLQPFIATTHELAEALFVREADVAEASSISVTVDTIEKLQALLTLIGYHNPAEALKGLLRRHDLNYLLQAIYYLSQLAHADSRQEFAPQRHLPLATLAVVPDGLRSIIGRFALASTQA